jgi:PAS domain S-box-containing protein
VAPSDASALFDVVGEGAPVGLAFLDSELRFVRINAALAAINGQPVAAHLGRRLEDVLPDIAAEVVPIYRRVLETGEPALEREVTGPMTSTGEVRHVLASWFPVSNGVGVVVVDITARKVAERRQAMLLRAGEVLDSAPGVDERLDGLARALVPELADYVKIELLEGAHGRRPVAIAHQDPEREALMRAWRERGTLGEDERVGMGTTMATGEAKLTHEIAEDAVLRSARQTTGEEGAELMRAIGPRSQIVVPLRARGRVLGALSLTMAESGRRYSEADLNLARDLGLRAGLAVDNARLYEEAQAAADAEQRRAQQLEALARTLQESLLPRALPEIEGLEAEARYLPGGKGTLVGGDLYDLFPVNGDWALVVGDVCGKGPEAAALTALVRYTVRAEAVHHAGPGDVLRLLNAAILRQDVGGRFCTVLHGRIRVSPGRARLVLASGGHPPPLVLRGDGSVEVVPCSGSLLGVLDEITPVDMPVELAPGDAIVSYTDGVTEARGPDGMFGDERLAAVLAEGRGDTARALADRVVRAVQAYRGDAEQDDLALVVLRVRRA